MPDHENFKYLWNVTLHNPTTQASSVSFRIEAREVKAGPVFTASTQPIALPPGERRLTTTDIKLVDVSCKKGYEAFVASGKVLPEGDYTYVITLVPGMTQSVFFLRVRVPKPVELIWPANGALVDDTQPMFVWKPPEVSGPIVRYHYSLRVVEVTQGQNAATAIRRNRPVFEKSGVPTTAFRTPPPAKLAASRTYAWRVTVTDTAGVPVDTVRTQSQAGTFMDKPVVAAEDSSTSFAFLNVGASVAGDASLVVRSDAPDAELCILEYVLGSDSTSKDWHIIGSFTRGQRSFVCTWSSDSAVIRAGKSFPMPAIVRATVLGRKGQRSRSVLQPLVINAPPPPTRRGCGCDEDQKK